VAAFTVVEVYPAPWQVSHERDLCLSWRPVFGGTPWQLVQDSVAVGDHDPVPWQELAQLVLVAFQPMAARISLRPFLCVAALTLVAL
jgi:hypothetical protein